MTKKLLLLFDIDGTLTEPRQKITPEMIEQLEQLKDKENIDLGFVDGSDYCKQKEQLGQDKLNLFKWKFNENGLITFKENKEIHSNNSKYSKYSKNFKDYMGEKHFTKFINIILKNLAKTEIPKKRGTFIEYRDSVLNISPIGRACNQDERDEFEIYDELHNVRKNLIESIKQDWKNYCYFNEDSKPELQKINYSIGGQISFDVFPEGWDKTYCLQFVENEYDEIHFFGDKTYKGGNDYEIFNDKRVIGHKVETYKDTIKLLKLINK
ncbi:hypothetical protein CL656_00160 [bacterium]|nr:hypothetical protein [bacterium]|tara:strand:- start:7377 stop:8177 length:801 start_codon:yes stop_codon:yes gene_type:complete